MDSYKLPTAARRDQPRPARQVRERLLPSQRAPGPPKGSSPGSKLGYCRLVRPRREFWRRREMSSPTARGVGVGVGVGIGLFGQDRCPTGVEAPPPPAALT